MPALAAEASMARSAPRNIADGAFFNLHRSIALSDTNAVGNMQKAPLGVADQEVISCKRLDASLLPMFDADHSIIG